MTSVVKKRCVLEQSPVFKLSLVQHNKKKWYEIAYYSWGGNGTRGTFRDKEVRAFFDTVDHPQVAPTNKWKIKSRAEAYKKYTWANLRWT